MNLLRFVGKWILTCALSLLFAGNACAAETVVGPERWEKEIAAFESGDAENLPEKGGIVFVGSSSIRRWKTLAADFPDHRLLKRGFGGSHTIS
jgi:hypothetical protein